MSHYYSREIALGMGMEGRRFVRELLLASLLHDIGKIGIRDDVLLKPGKLSEEEFSELASHPVRAYKMLRHYEFMHGALDMVLSHHERPDGLGYPDKLRANRIPLGASIIAVADGFDAMTSNRPYRRSLGFDRAVSELKDHTGRQFHKEAAGAFLSVLTPAMHERALRSSQRPLAEMAEELYETVIS